jgi:hypothetical protein
VVRKKNKQKPQLFIILGTNLEKEIISIYTNIGRPEKMSNV